MRYDTVLFDLDGTLTRSHPGIVASARYAISKMNYPMISDSALLSFVGPPLYDSFKNTVGMTEEDSIRAVDVFRENFKETGWKDNSVYKDIPHLLKQINDEGGKIIICTSKQQALAEKVVDYFLLRPYIHKIVGNDPKNLHPNKADLVKYAITQSKCACMVGDRRFDVEGGKANNIDTFAVSYGYGSLEELNDAKPTGIAKSIEELAQLIIGKPLKKTGMFMSIEGSDGCGKSTQANLTEQRLTDAGFTVKRTREPGGCPVSEKIRDILLSNDNKEITPVTEALLFAAARAQHVNDIIKPYVKEGSIVLSDRYIDSSLAFQGMGRGLGMDWVNMINERAMDNVLPLITVFLTLDPNVAIDRRTEATAPDRIESEKDGFVNRVYMGFKQVLNMYPQRVKAVNAEGTPEEVNERIINLIIPALLKR